MTLKSPFKRGIKKQEVGGGDSGGFLKIPPNSTVKVVPLVTGDEVLKAMVHEFWPDAWGIQRPVIFPCMGTAEDGCIGDMLGNDAKEKGYMPVIAKDEDGNQQTFILAFGAMINNQLVTILEDSDIKGMVLKITRSGKGKSTKYQVMPTINRLDDPELDPFIANIPDIEKMVGPTDPDEIKAKFIDAGLDFSRFGISVPQSGSSDDDDLF